MKEQEEGQKVLFQILLFFLFSCCDQQNWEKESCKAETLKN
jgi:hypothetical protein